jgi:hypothetical protein
MRISKAALQVLHRSLRRGLLATIVGGLLLGMSHAAQAGEFFAIIANLTNVRNPQAWIDAAFDTRGAPEGTNVLFRVSDVTGIIFDEFELPVNQNGFVSSASFVDNLFAVSGNQPALVHVRGPAGVVDQSAIVRQTLKSGHFAVSILPARRVNDDPLAIGTQFSVALGSGARATLLVANVSGGDVTVDLFLGTKGADGSGFQSNPRLTNRSLWIVEIDPAAANSNLVLSSTGNIVAQLAVETGRNTINGVTLLPIN